jgi:hypothetical protein
MVRFVNVDEMEWKAFLGLFEFGVGVEFECEFECEFELEFELEFEFELELELECECECECECDYYFHYFANRVVVFRGCFELGVRIGRAEEWEWGGEMVVFC